MIFNQFYGWKKFLFIVVKEFFITSYFILFHIFYKFLFYIDNFCFRNKVLVRETKAILDINYVFYLLNML